MDGNGRWAQRRGLSRVEGHRYGVDTVKRVVQYCIKHEVPVLSLFAFSTENWGRPPEEVNSIMHLFMQAIDNELQSLDENGVRLRFIGSRHALKESLCARMTSAEQQTSRNEKLILNIIVNYSGRWDIVQATQKIAEQVVQGKILSSDINETLVQEALSTNGLPDPDLLIRTSGELRVSNFFLWQFAYTEFYFTEVLWPDFDENDFLAALHCFEQRHRRFGKVDEEVF